MRSEQDTPEIGDFSVSDDVSRGYRVADQRSLVLKVIAR